MEVQNKKYSIMEFLAGSLTNIIFLGTVFLIGLMQADPSCEGPGCGMMELVIVLISVPVLFITGLIELFVFNISKQSKPFVYNKIYLKVVSIFYCIAFLTTFYSYIIFKITKNFNMVEFIFSILMAIMTIFLINKYKKRNSNPVYNAEENMTQTPTEPLIQNQKPGKLKYFIGIVINLIILSINVWEIMDFMKYTISTKAIISIILLLIFSVSLLVIIIKECLYLKKLFTSEIVKENKLLANSPLIMLACLILSWFILVILDNITSL